MGQETSGIRKSVNRPKSGGLPRYFYPPAGCGSASWELIDGTRPSPSLYLLGERLFEVNVVDFLTTVVDFAEGVALQDIDDGVALS
jgi:hypothetical protein